MLSGYFSSFQFCDSAQSAPCHKRRPCLVYRPKESGRRLKSRSSTRPQRTWIGRQRRKEKTHVKMVFAATNRRLRAKLEL
jgi:hypothetical protein